MMKLVEKIFGKPQATDPVALTFIKPRKAILKALEDSKERGNFIGVYSRVFGEGMFLTCVDDIERDGKGEVIVFATYDMSGHILSRTRVSIEEIKMVCPFNKAYVNPVLGSSR